MIGGEAIPRWLSAMLCVAVGLMMVILSQGFPSAGQAGDPGTAAFPQLAGLGLVALGSYQFTRRTSAEPLPSGSSAVQVLAMLAVLLVYTVVFPRVEFVAGATVFLLATMWIAGERALRILVPVAVGGSVACAFLLMVLAGVPLPSGLIEGLIFG